MGGKPRPHRHARVYLDAAEIAEDTAKHASPYDWGLCFTAYKVGALAVANKLRDKAAGRKIR